MQLTLNNVTSVDHLPGKNSGEIYVCCQYCDTRGKSTDKGYHMGVSLNKGIYHCFRCGASGKLGNIEEFRIFSQEDVSDLDLIRSKILSKFNSREVSIIDLDKISKRITKEDTPFSYDYIYKTRGLTELDVEKYSIRMGIKYEDNGREVRKFSGRIIFPVLVDGICVYFTARSINGKDPKYLNSDGMKSTLVYNLDSVRGGQCIICEGILSSIAAEKTTGIPAVCVFGKSPSFIQLSRIKSRCDKVYISMDGDVTEEEIRKIVRRCKQVGFSEILVVNLPKDKDPDDLGGGYEHYFSTSIKIGILDLLRKATPSW